MGDSALTQKRHTSRVPEQQLIQDDSGGDIKAELNKISLLCILLGIPVWHLTSPDPKLSLVGKAVKLRKICCQGNIQRKCACARVCVQFRERRADGVGLSVHVWSHALHNSHFHLKSWLHSLNHQHSSHRFWLNSGACETVTHSQPVFLQIHTIFCLASKQPADLSAQDGSFMHQGI